MLSENIFESNELKKDLVNEGLFIMLAVVRIQSNEVFFCGEPVSFSCFLKSNNTRARERKS